MKEKQKQKLSLKVRAILLALCLAIGVGIGIAYAAETSSNAADTQKLKNGSFEEGTFDWNGKLYLQPAHTQVPSWNTTAYNTTGNNGLIELFKENPSTYLTGPNVTLKPSDGEIAAELNADEESTLFQVVSTSPSSIYEWGLDHGARTTKDVMALVIGPAQSVNPSKPSKAGRDQFMQMVDWLKSDKNSSIKAEISAITAGSEPKHYKVYSKKFAAKGDFADNSGNNAFSLTPSTIYTEEWHIWIMASERGKDTSQRNPWNHYGSNAHGSAGSNTGNGSTNVDLSKYYLYTVPAGQSKTLFGFVSISSVDKGPTFGNFLDDINFQLYHPLSGSSTTHGSAVVGSSDGTSSGTGSSNGHTVTVDDKLATYITHGQPLKIQAVVTKTGEDNKGNPIYDGCEFVGVYYTTQDENGEAKTVFLQLAGNNKWVKTNNAAGDIVYTYSLENITSATDLHFVFIKNPTITYDPNGGKPYVVAREYNKDEADNVYSFKPARFSQSSSGVDAVSSATQKETFIPPYVSKAAEGQNDGWKFLGWKLTGDTVTIPEGVKIDTVNADRLGSLLLPAVHTVACNYSVDGATSERAAQYFKIYGESMMTMDGTLSYKDNGEVTGVTWEDNGATKVYANVHKGLTMVAQWRWRQAFIPQAGSGTNYSDSASGGTVEITSVTNKSDTNYNAAYETVGKSYFAETDETITATATANPGYTFEGWYDAKGNLVTTNVTYSYTETKESVNTYYARFSGSVTQTYIRQVGSGNNWVDTEDDKIGKLGRYKYIDAPGMPISSTATAGTGYKFVGWYYKDGDAYMPVDSNMLINKGATISYTTTGNATYYARFETAYTVKFVAQTKQADGSFKTDTVGGKVSKDSVTDVADKTASSKATVNTGYKFLGWYDKNGKQLSTDATYSPKITADINNVIYYARFEIVYTPTIESKVYLSFVAESADVQIPSAFDGRDAGTGKNTNDYGLNNKFGNTISTGFKYKISTVDMTNVKTIQITVTVPASAYVKVDGTGKFTGNGTDILKDSDGVIYNKGSIQQISGATTLTYYWDAAGLQAGTTYGFVIDSLYAPDATATITVNGTSGTKVTNDNGVVNTASGDYRGKSHYPQ